MKSFDKVFLTGCDAKTEWMLGWFVHNYRKFNKTPLVFADFGVGEEARNVVASGCDSIIDMRQFKEQGWFKKPQAMIEASKLANKVCWIDTDCHVLANLTHVFDLIQPNKLAMVEDKPWSKRRGETWHNSGVVAFESRPPILDTWAAAIRRNPAVGDQEVLHELVKGGLNRQIHISDLPQEYNWLRLMLVDGQDSPRKKVMHWTGAKGKEHIRGLMND